MYPHQVPLSSVAVGATAAAFLFVSVFMGSGRVLAGEMPEPPRSILIDAGATPGARRASISPDVPPYLPQPEPGDAAAALEAVQIALSEAGDGATYVWRRGNGRLAGTVRPTATFRDAEGRMCRHVEMRMRLGTYQRQTEGIACRGGDGVWDLEG